jgi:hypothetical protein
MGRHSQSFEKGTVGLAGIAPITHRNEAAIRASAARLIAARPPFNLFRFCNMPLGGFSNRLNQLLLRCSQKMHNGSLTK